MLPKIDILRMMSSQSQPTITSFVIRFVMDPSSQPKATPSYRGAIRHIQSEDEIQFNTWNEAVEFIQRYVPLQSGLEGLEITDQ